jgi:HD-like signal output (HDOD) protein
MSLTVLTQPTAGDAHALLSQLQFLTLPQTAVRCLETVSRADPVRVGEQLCAVIASDPPLAARLVAVANSAFFALPRPVFEVRTAVLNVLGVDLARNLALSMAMSACFDLCRCQPFDLCRYWTTALVTAELLADRSRRPPGLESPPGALELCGLLRGLGLLALAHVAPRPVGAALIRASRGQSLATALGEEIGVDQRQALEILVGRWRLPALIAEVCGASRPASDPALRLRPVVEAACTRADAWWATGLVGTGGTGDTGDTGNVDGLDPAESRAAERLWRMVAACVPAR